jgi:protein phosphatase
MAAAIGVRASILTDVGRRGRVNEDWCGVLEPRSDEEAREDGWLWVVADGVGAYGTGEEASRAAGETILNAYRLEPRADPLARLQQAVEAGNRAVWERHQAYVRRGEARLVMTTVVAALILGERAILANVGDCRAYLIRDGRLRQLTRDHTWVAEQVARGLMSAEQARNHPRGHIVTRALGQRKSVQVDLYEQLLKSGDRLVLCSDGLTRYLDERAILQMAVSAPAQVAAGAMLDLANARGGEDNISVAVIEVYQPSDPAPSTP